MIIRILFGKSAKSMTHLLGICLVDKPPIHRTILTKEFVGRHNKNWAIMQRQGWARKILNRTGTRINTNYLS